MKPYLLSKDDRKLFGGITGQLAFLTLGVTFAFIAYIVIFSTIPLFFKLWISMCVGGFIVAKILTPKEIDPDSILLRIDKEGISLRSCDSMTFIRWKQIRKVDVDCRQCFVDMYITTTSGCHHFDLAGNGAIRYYNFRHKLRHFADDRSKINCPIFAS